MMHVAGIKSVTAVIGRFFVISPSILTKCLSGFSLLVVEQCICNRIQADEMVLEWVAFSTNKNGLTLNLDNLEQFEHEVAIYDLFHG